MKVTRILHASVNVVGNLDETRGFYAEVLGLQPAERPEIPGVPGQWFSVGDSQVHLVGAPPSGQRIDPTGHHFCLAVSDIQAAISELESAGVPYVRATQGPNDEVIQVWISDPASNTIELQQDRSLT